MAILTLRNVLPELFQNNLDKEFVYDELKLIPYRGTNRSSSHASLKIQYDLAELSPSQGICINELCRTAFRGDVDLIRGGRRGLKYDVKSLAISDNEKDLYVDAIESLGIDLVDISETMQEAFKHYKKSGVAYVKYTEETLAGAKRVSLENIDTRNAMIQRKERTYDPSILFIMPKMITGYEDISVFYGDVVARKFKQIPIYPNFKESGDKRECVFMFKKGTMVYGVPDSIHTLRDQWIEYALTELGCKVSGTEFVATKLLKYQETNVAKETTKGKEGFQQLALQFSQVMTNEGNKAKSLVMARVPPNVNMEFEDLAFNRDQKWFDSQMAKATGNIYATHGVYKQLTGTESAKSNIGGNVIGDLMTIFDYKTIMGYQKEFSDFALKISDVMMEFVGEEGMKGTRILFPRTIDEIKQNLADGDSFVEQVRGSSQE